MKIWSLNSNKWLSIFEKFKVWYAGKREYLFRISKFPLTLLTIFWNVWNHQVENITENSIKFEIFSSESISNLLKIYWNFLNLSWNYENITGFPNVHPENSFFDMWSREKIL